MAYVPPYPIFQVLTHSLVQNEGNPDATNDPASISVTIRGSHLHADSQIKYWVAGDDALGLWPALPSGSFYAAAGDTTFTLTYQPDSAPHLDEHFTLYFYPQNDITLAGYGGVDITILDDDSPYDGDDAANVIAAAATDDVVNARGGDDTVHARGGNDQVSGGPGNDTLYGGGGNDYLRGDDGDNFFYGGGGADTLIARGGTETLDGGNGDDVLDAGGSSNTLTGGNGADTFVFHWAAFANHVTDFVHGVDHIQISMSDWHLYGTPAFQNKADATGDGQEFFFDAANHTLYYTPLAPGDDGSPYTKYAVAVLDGVDKLSLSDFVFVT